jgi:hypothetical protein
MPLTFTVAMRRGFEGMTPAYRGTPPGDFGESDFRGTPVTSEIDTLTERKQQHNTFSETKE